MVAGIHYSQCVCTFEICKISLIMINLAACRVVTFTSVHAKYTQCAPYM